MITVIHKNFISIPLLPQKRIDRNNRSFSVTTGIVGYQNNQVSFLLDTDGKRFLTVLIEYVIVHTVKTYNNNSLEIVSYLFR